MNENAKTVLLAEDEPSIAFSLKYLFEREGFVVESTDDGGLVEQKARGILPDVIVLDIMLPNKSGFEILQGLRQGKTTKDIPIMMLSARGQAADIERARRLGANEYLVKPFSNSEIVERLKQLMRV